jgi:hypothetical protein
MRRLRDLRESALVGILLVGILLVRTLLLTRFRRSLERPAGVVKAALLLLLALLLVEPLVRALRRPLRLGRPWRA